MVIRLWFWGLLVYPELYCDPRGGEEVTLGISGWGCAAGTLEPLTYNRASSAKFCYPILEKTPQIPLS